MDKVIYLSTNVENSDFVSKSQNIFDSTNIFDSSNIRACSDVVESDEVTDSQKVFTSSFIEESSKVLESSNVAKSLNVCNSVYVIESKSILDSNNVIRSSEIIKSYDTTDSHFCENCREIENCLFCRDLQGAQYHIFNKPVDKARFEFIARQYEKYRNFELNFVDEWYSGLLMNIKPKVKRNFSKYYPSEEEHFWKWIKTLPGYDSDILYAFTMNPAFLFGTN